MKYIKQLVGKLAQSEEEPLDIKILRLEEITVDNTLNPRIGALDQETVLDYSAHIDDLPAMIVFDGRAWDAPGFYLVGGFHRYAAHQFAGRDVAKFIVRQGDRRAAEEAADLDNLTHGLHLTRAERRGVVRRYLKRHPERSDVWAAKECRTTDKTVRSVREEMEEMSEIPRLDKFIGVDGIERPRSVERPQKPDADEEARRLTPVMTGWDAHDAAAEVEGEKLSDYANLVTFTAQPCEDCGDPEFHWTSPETVECANCGKTWDKVSWLRRHSPAGVESREAAIEAERELDTYDATSGLMTVAGQPDSEPDDEMPEWLREDEADGNEAGEPAETPTARTQAEAEVTGESAVVTQARAADLESRVAAHRAKYPEPLPVPGPKTDWVAPVREFKATAPAPKPVVPPPPTPAPALPPPPPPVVGRAALAISVSIHVSGVGLLSAMEGDKVLVSSKSVQPSAVMWEIQQLIDGYLSKEEMNVNTV